MEYTWTLVSNADDPSGLQVGGGGGGGGGETGHCNVPGPHPDQILILSNESSAQAAAAAAAAAHNQTLATCGPPPPPPPPPPDGKGLAAAGRMLHAESGKLHLAHHDRSDFVGGIDNEALDFSHLTDEFIQNSAEASQFFQETAVDHNDHVMVRINTPYQQEQLQFLKSEPMPSVADLPFHGNSILSSLPPNKQTKDKSHSYTNRHNLPESPPDSEPPYSPADGVGQSPHRKTPNLQCLISSNKAQQLSTTNGNYQKQPAMTTKVPHPVHTLMINQPGSSSHVTHLDFNQMPPNVREIEIAEPEYTDLLNVNAESKKRKLCADAGGSNVRVKKETENCAKKTVTHVSPSGRSVCSEDSYTYQDSCESGLYNDTSFQCIRFQPFQESSWNTLCDHSLKELPIPHYRVDADKGFNFSNVDDAFVCQKKNHFQITCHTQLQGDAQFVRTTEGIHKVSGFQLHFYGVKVESPGQTIKVEQSQSDRSKKSFHPVLLDLREQQVSKVTVGRLHFSETTCNNMRKKGKPNPDQRYFYLVVGLHAHCVNDHDYPVVSYASERIIVRASNPGQFESDAELCWQRGATPESIVHTGKVGVNTDRPDEALVVHGNVKLTGHIVQPSDVRIKQHVRECDTSQQLRNVQKINVVHFNYKPEFSSLFGLSPKEQDTGIIAQEVQTVLPEAVKNAGDITLPNGTTYEDFLVVNKDRIFMENVGAVKELSKITSHLEARICELEQNKERQLTLLKNDTSNVTLYRSPANTCPIKNNYDFAVDTRKSFKRKNPEDGCFEQFSRISIIALIATIVSCLVFIGGLFFIEHLNETQKKHENRHNYIVRQPKVNTIETRNDLGKNAGQLPMEIDRGILDKDKRLNCMWFKQLVANTGGCEYNKIKSKMNKIAERKKGRAANEKTALISFIVKIDRAPTFARGNVAIGVYGSRHNTTAETNDATCGGGGRSEQPVQQCGGESRSAYGFQLPVDERLAEYFISVSYRDGKRDRKGCPTSMSMTTTCPTEPYATLEAANGTLWDQPTDKRSYEWPAERRYSVSEDADSVTVIVRYKPWPYERFKASCGPSKDKRTVAVVEYTVSLHKDCGVVA